MRPRLSLANRFGRFLVVGGIATVSQYSVLVAAVQLFRAPPVPASGLGYLVGAVVNYQLNRRFTFRRDAAHSVALPRFMVIAAVGLAINQTLMHVFSTRLGWPYLLAQIAATILVVVWNFAGNSLWTFRGDP